MSENPIFRRNIHRPSLDSDQLTVYGVNGTIQLTSGWEIVAEGKGVKYQSWKINGLSPSTEVDGADIIIEAGGYTPIQLVKTAEIVIDAPENSRCFSVVMDTDGQIYVNGPDELKDRQIVYSQGMIITLIAETETRVTEFESPAFNPDMFETVPEDNDQFQGRSMTKYLRIVRQIRQQVSTLAY